MKVLFFGLKNKKTFFSQQMKKKYKKHDFHVFLLKNNKFGELEEYHFFLNHFLAHFFYNKIFLYK